MQRQPEKKTRAFRFFCIACNFT